MTGMNEKKGQTCVPWHFSHAWVLFLLGLSLNPAKLVGIEGIIGRKNVGRC